MIERVLFYLPNRQVKNFVTQKHRFLAKIGPKMPKISKSRPFRHFKVPKSENSDQFTLENITLSSNFDNFYT